ncbi:MAG: LysR family transcriptional regulator [Paracoccaceae bacterium]|jgi:DNA-binding transcriptional LysR family regulator
MTQMNAITLKQLRALAAVDERGSITAAADLLNLTVPAVSTQLKQLEANIGAELLVRASDGKGTITRQGLKVLATIKQIESALNNCAKTIDSINSGKSGLVTLGVVSTGKYFAPSLVALAKKQLPDIRVNLIIGNRRHIISALEDQSVDLAIMGRPPRFPAVESVALGDHPHIMIAPPDHPLVGTRDISPERLLAETFIMREAGSGTRILMERFLDRHGEGLTYDRIDFNTNETIKQAVIAGLGIAMISAHTVTDALTAGRIATIDMPGLPIVRQWHLVRPINAALTPVTEKVREFLITLNGSFLPHLP